MPAQVNNQRITKNTLLPYGRMLLIMAVSLYTSRVVLNSLGVGDYGIYNVVGGIVSMFAFLNRPMMTSAQRYLTFEFGMQPSMFEARIPGTFCQISEQNWQIRANVH